MLLWECVKEPPFAKKVTFPHGEKEKNPPTHCFGKSFLLICVPASLPQTMVTRATLTTAWTTHMSSTMSKSPAHFHSPTKPRKHYFAQQDPRNTDVAELCSSGLKGFPSHSNDEELSLLCLSHLCWFHSLGRGRSQLCYQKITAAVQHLFCSEF